MKRLSCRWIRCTNFVEQVVAHRKLKDIPTLCALTRKLEIGNLCWIVVPFICPRGIRGASIGIKNAHPPRNNLPVLAVYLRARARKRLIYKVDNRLFPIFCRSIFQMLQVHRHKLRSVSLISEIEVRQRQSAGYRTALELRSFNEILVDILSHQIDMAIPRSDETIGRTQALIGTRTCRFIGRHLVFQNKTVINIRKVERLTLVHAIDAVFESLFVGLGNFLPLALTRGVRDARIIVRTNQIDKVLLISSLIVLNRVQCIKSAGFELHLQVEILEHCQGRASVLRVTHDRAKTIVIGLGIGWG